MLVSIKPIAAIGSILGQFDFTLFSSHFLWNQLFLSPVLSWDPNRPAEAQQLCGNWRSTLWWGMLTPSLGALDEHRIMGWKIAKNKGLCLDQPCSVVSVILHTLTHCTLLWLTPWVLRLSVKCHFFWKLPWSLTPSLGWLPLLCTPQHPLGSHTCYSVIVSLSPE